MRHENEIVQTRLDRPSLLLLVRSLLKPAPTILAATNEPVANSDRPPVSSRAAATGRSDRLVSRALVAQVLAASTYPTEIVEAERWIARSFQPERRRACWRS